ncbi:MAG: HAD-IIIA family hydrolase [Alphaproteobacteria bacterium]
MTLPKLILLDRDGVINEERTGYVKSVEEFNFIPDSIQAIKQLSDAGIKLAIITNQGCIGRNLITMDQLEEIHQHLIKNLKQHHINLHKIYVCPDHPDFPTHRRKPNAGMLLEAMSDLDVTPSETLMIGDDIRDLKAARAAGCAAHLVLTGHGTKTAVHEEFKNYTPVAVHANLKAAAAFILGENQN